MENNEEKINIDKELSTLKYNPDNVSHLNPDLQMCKICKSKVCTIICPASVYKWNEENNTIIVNYENCLECGACRIACEKKSLKWEYPKGNKGVTFRQG